MKPQDHVKMPTSGSLVHRFVCAAFGAVLMQSLDHMQMALKMENI